jgi:DNA uptake protein ComE-like DNA-binding protein
MFGERYFYWMKSYLGFSRKESRGFLFLIPVLIFFGLTPSLIRMYKNNQADHTFSRYLQQLDSLDKINIKLVSSPNPTFNPRDTVIGNRNQKQLNNLNRIPFAEADSITLQIVPGIGQASAGRIIKYRENLGGFHSKTQLMEVFGIKEETAASLWEFFEFEPVIFRKISINTATVEQLSAHPYISYGEAKVLHAFRKQHGNFSSSADLLKIKIFKVDWVEKISPYLDFE